MNPNPVQEELQLMRTSVRALLERSGGVGRARKSRAAGEAWSADVMAELAQAGVFAAAVPEAEGGLGMGLAAAGIIAEEVGRVLAPEPVVATIGLGIGLLRRLCPGHPLLGEALSGIAVLATAWQERGSSSASDKPTCRLRGDVLTGTKSWVVGSAAANRLLVVADADGRPALASVDPRASGVSIEMRRQADGSEAAEVHFAGAPAEVLAEGSAAVGSALADAVSDATALAAAELIGLSARAVEITLEHIATREQFGKPIGSFQVIQHRAVDMHVMREVAEASVREALEQMDASSSSRVRAQQASRAKARACTAARMITRQAIQLHGAVGYTYEYDIGLYLNRSLVLSAWLGDAAHHRRSWFEARGVMETSQ